MDANSGQFWQQRLELSKDPFGEVFAGRIFQSWNVIQVVVIESFIQGLEDRLDFGEITDPADMGIDFAFKVDSDAEGMAVQPSTFMTLWNMRQEVGRLKRKFFKNFHNLQL